MPSSGTRSASPCIDATVVGRQDGRKDAVALHALRPERVRVGAVRDQHRRDDRVRVAALDRRLEVAVERRVLRGHDRVVRLVDQLDLRAPDRRAGARPRRSTDPSSSPAARGSRGPASATDGITLIFGGSPTPERNQVSAIVDCWIALVNLFAANVPTRAFMTSSTERLAADGSDGWRRSVRLPSSRAAP